MNCGPGGSYLSGSWAALELPVCAWSAWCWKDGKLIRVDGDWGEVRDVLAVMALHPNGFATWMWYVDGYPPPPGVDGETKDGHQIEEVNSGSWREVVARIKDEAEAWRRRIT